VPNALAFTDCERIRGKRGLARADGSVPGCRPAICRRAEVGIAPVNFRITRIPGAIWTERLNDMTPNRQLGAK